MSRVFAILGFLGGCLAVSGLDAEAQQTGQIVGQVVEAGSGAPVSAAQVHLPGTDLGTLSRQNGGFLILNVPVGTHQVTAERIGMGSVTQEVDVTAGGSIQVRFELETQALGLDEIVVTGAAGASRQREIGNTITQLNPADRLDNPMTTSDLLQASAPGLDLMTNDGMLGQGSRITLRGNASIATGNQPIIYVDGVRIMSEGFSDTHGLRSAHVTSSPLDFINPNDIDRIEVIKGSAATTLYGTEAASGVIQIFTKSGSDGGAPLWTWESEAGTSWSRKFGVEPEPYFFMDDFLRRGYNHGHAASVQGGGQNVQYFLSGQFEDATGIMPLDEMNRYAVRGNVTFSPIQDLTVQWNTSLSRQDLQSTPTGRNSHGITMNAFRQSGNYFSDGNPEVVGQLLDWDIFQDIQRFTTGGTITHTPTSNLTNRLTVGFDHNLQESRDIRPFGFVFEQAGNVFNRTWQRQILTLDYVGTYSFDISDNMISDFSIGGQAIGEDTRSLQGEGEGIPGSGKNATLASAAIVTSTESREKEWNAGFFVQNVFDISNRYFLTLGVRVDGNSNFGDDFGLQVYPKASASWIISEEDFWSDSFGEEMKLRFAYGASGRAPGAFDAVQTWNAQGWTGRSAFTPSNVGSGDLGPEVTHELEGGFDGAWWNGRLTGSFTYYRQTTSDALIAVGQIPSSGFGGSQLENVGKILNQGTELSLDVAAIDRADWGWDVGLAFTTNKSEALELGDVKDFSAMQARVIEGQPVPVIVGARVTNPNEIAEPIIEDDHIYGPMMPTRTLSANTTVRFPYGILLSARGEYRGGHTRNVSIIDIGRQAPAMYCNDYYVEQYERYDASWTPQLRDGIPALARARCHPSLFDDDFYQFDSDFFRLRSVSLTVPLDFAFPDRVNTASLTMALNNAYLWTKLPWWDPETLPQAGGVNATGFGQDQDEKIPGGISFRTSVRLTF